MPEEGALEDELSQAAAAIESRKKELIAAQIEALKQFSHYRNVPVADLERSCDRNVLRVVSMLRGDPDLPPDVVEDERLSGERRARQGIPPEVVVAAYRAVIGVIRDAFLEMAPREGISVEGILSGVRRLWILTDQFSSTLVAARHKVELEQARLAEQDRLTFLHRALDGSASAADLISTGQKYGFRDDANYWVVRGEALDADVGGIQRLLEREGGTAEFSPVIAGHGSSIVGILGRAPGHVSDHAYLVAIAGPVPLRNLQAAASEAAQVLNAARSMRQFGLVDRASLSLRITVVEEDAVGALLHRRYVEPVRLGSGMAEDVLASVRALLDHRRSIPDAAQELSVHVNTLRYRLDKFEELTGCDLSDTDCLVEVWWALHYDYVVEGGWPPRESSIPSDAPARSTST